MARGLNMKMIGFVAAMVAAAMFSGSEAQTTHVVGDALGWLVPPAGDAAYSSWASTKTFRVGDILVFNFTTGTHNVAEVTKEAFGRCTTASPISLQTSGPARITLSSPGEHFYLCTFSSHCGLGQKLGINVSAASSSSPAPQPAIQPPPPASTPSPVPVSAPAPSGVPTPAPSPTPSVAATPAPSPSSVSQVYTVGDRLGWTVPQGGAAAYQTWASNKNFMVGDVLVFNFASGAHNVAEVTKTAFDSCNTSAPLSTETSSPARIMLSRPGEHYYLCTFPGHCSLGQKLAVNVSGTAATSPTGSATPPSDAFGPAAPTNPATESPTSPSENSAPSAAVIAALPLTFMSIALAFLY